MTNLHERTINEFMDGDVTRILETAGAKVGLPSEDLLPLVYDELRSLAAARIRGEAQGQTLQATALVHEAWLRVSGKGGRTWNDRAHFFRVAALEMRRILVENARRKSRVKRGPGMERIDIEGIELADTQPDDRIILIDDALRLLETDDPDSARIITLKFFGGLTNREIAGMENVTERTIERQWAFARTRLFELICDEM
ncbi:MAG: ECF-type sigma factor [Verrucomicrobiota bacterium]